jgi:hypothetical protein
MVSLSCRFADDIKEGLQEGERFTVDKRHYKLSLASHHHVIISRFFSVGRLTDLEAINSQFLIVCVTHKLGAAHVPFLDKEILRKVT